ncbi:hypothetical protein EG327_006023 [Venturia inaequalis]|uniref:Large ribosomal subunit protein uL5m n=1 Tax=Venturia inaequalis TaxID=5025 RepID=A0A8H3ZH67_VENIN|nr:hypothetical protein EG327_006023 [Venturia inaequalis]
MALQELRRSFGPSLLKKSNQCLRLQRIGARRCISSIDESHPNDLETTSFQVPPPTEDIIKSFDPVGQSKRRSRQLPPSRYKFRPPRYYRGPLHPYQPPPPSDPASREFIPGPFTLSRLEQTYESTAAHDLLTLAYTHLPPGVKEPVIGERLRSWEGDSPYFANRPLRAPKGGSVLRPVHKRITFQNVPKLERITVHTMVSQASNDSAYLHVAGMVVQSITNVRIESHKSKRAVQQWALKKDKYVAVTAELYGEDMHHFLAKCVDLVMPRIKDWKGVKGSSGDGTGCISFGFDAESVALFPEIEVNYDMYPPKMIPGCHVTVHTSATTNREARLLLSSLGVPFYGDMNLNN